MSRHRIAALLVSLPVVVLAQGQDGGGNAPPLPPEPPRPAVAAPTEAPPPAPASGAATAPSSYVPPGRWVHTAQYGWVWMPYEAQYYAIPGDPQVFPEAFVFYPAYGWRWVVAPWVYGYGPQPYWGPGGVVTFSWWARPWFRVGGYWGWGGYRGWGPYRGWMGPRRWGPHGWAHAPAYYRTGVGEHRPMPVRPGRAAPAPRPHPGRGAAEREHGRHGRP